MVLMTGKLCLEVQSLLITQQFLCLTGYDADKRRALDTVELYHPTENLWWTMNSLNYPRRRFGVTVVNGVIYVVGGCEQNSVEYYDCRSKKWIVAKGVSVNRYDCTCFALPPPQCF